MSQPRTGGRLCPDSALPSALIDYLLLHRIPVEGGCPDWSGRMEHKRASIPLPDGRTIGAHRVAYALSRGLSLETTPPYILRTCNDNYCTDPNHLFSFDTKKEMVLWCRNQKEPKVIDISSRKVLHYISTKKPKEAIMARRRGRNVAANQSPGEAAAAAAAPPPVVPNPPGAPANPASPFAGLTQAAPTPPPPPAPATNPFASLVPPVQQGHVEEAHGLGHATPGPIERAIGVQHGTPAIAPGGESLVQQSIVNMMGTLGQLSNLITGIQKEVKNLQTGQTKLSKDLNDINKNLSGGISGILHEFRGTIEALRVAPPPAAAPPPPAPAPAVAPSAAPVGTTPGVPAIPAPAGGGPTQRQQAISQMICEVLASQHYVAPGAMEIKANYEQHVGLCVQIIADRVPFNSENPAADPVCQKEVVDALTACGKVDATGTIRP